LEIGPKGSELGSSDAVLDRSWNIIRILILVRHIYLVSLSSEDLVAKSILRYGYHVPAVRRRDLFYSKLEDQRAANAAA
jgi:hypothetical protein